MTSSYEAEGFLATNVADIKNPCLQLARKDLDHASPTREPFGFIGISFHPTLFLPYLLSGTF